ncbi:TPA: hypothetical protein VCA72_001010 [Streptococcus suis]|nr:hypothetical protein [Streptococcus suis]
MLKYKNLLSLFMDQVYNELYCLGLRNLDVDKENLYSLKFLSISNSSKHIKLCRVIDLSKTIIQFLFVVPLFFLINDFEVSIEQYHLFAIKVIFKFVITITGFRLLFNLIANFIYLLTNFIQKLVLSIHITTLLFITLLFVETIFLVGFLFVLYTNFGWSDILNFKQLYLQKSIIEQFYFVAIVIFLWQSVSLYLFIKQLTIFEKSSINYSVSILTGFLTVTTYLVGMDSDLSRVNFHTFILMQFLILVTILPFITGLVFRKNEELANSILKNQLLLPTANLDYDELVKSYSLGGGKIKEVIEKNEKFLKVVLWNEENPFYTWKTYDNYLEYKNYRYKQFQKK